MNKTEPNFLYSEFVYADRINDYLKLPNLLGIVKFEEESSELISQVPNLSVEVGSSNTKNFAEIWLSSEEVKKQQIGAFSFSNDGENLFGCISFSEYDKNRSLEEITKDVYIDLFEHIKNLGFPNLFRMWNYIPRITDEQDGMERYQAFCLGRNLAFKNAYKKFTSFLPAATGIAKNTTGSIEVYFLANKKKNMINLENPFQTPAYRYPKRYGPKPPSFARGTFVCRNENMFELYISGTASILGSQSMYPGNAEKQIQTTLDNIKNLINYDNLKNYKLENDFTLLDVNNIKVYYRNKSDLAIFKDYCSKSFSPDAQIVFINVDICRRDLLVEIEGSIQSYKLVKNNVYSEELQTEDLVLEDNFTIDVPTDYPRMKEQEFNYSNTEWNLSPGLSYMIDNAVRHYNEDESAFFLSGLSALFFYYTKSESISITTKYGVYNCTFSNNSTLNHLITSIKNCPKKVKILQCLDKGVDDSINDVLQKGQFFYQYTNSEGFILENDTIENRSNFNEYEILFDIAKKDNNYSFKLTYNDKLYCEESILRLVDHFENLLQEMLQHPKGLIGCINILTRSERAQIEGWNDNKSPFSSFSVTEIFEDQVKIHPNKEILFYEQEKWTYNEINRLANRLAKKIISENDCFKKPVGVFMDRSPQTLITILAIWKVGGIYVPLDTMYSEDYISYILEEVNAVIVISDKKQSNVVSKIFDKKVLSFDIILLNESDSIDEENLGIIVDPQEVASIFYTSGSTGKPKGVIVDHNYLGSRLVWGWAAYPFSDDDVFCQRSTVNFVVSIWEFFTGVLKGIPTVIISNNVVKDPLRLVHAIKEYKITYVLFVPSILKMILSLDVELNFFLNNIKCLITCGEPLEMLLFEQIKKILPQASFFNQYGASEVFDIAYCDAGQVNLNFYKKKQIRNLPVGKPIHNTKIHILNDFMQPLPIGIVGDIYVDKIGMASGYLSGETDNEGRFVKNPFTNKYSDKLYKMGDLGRYLPDGNIEVMGRKDFQVKIRGMRVELEGIESSFLTINGIQEAAVIAKEVNSGVKRLEAYIVANTIDVEDIRGEIKKIVPDFMVPSIIVTVNSLPRKPNGKLDRSSLLNYNGTDISSQKNVEPTDNKLEIVEYLRKEVSICFDVSIRSIKVDTPFLEMGADSFLLVQLIKSIKKTYSKELSIMDLFNYSTIELLANYLNETLNENPLNLKVKSNRDKSFIISDGGASADFNKEEIAIVGISGRVAGARDLEEFWDLLKKGEDSISEVTIDRWNSEKYYDANPQLNNKSISKWGGFLKDAEFFDPLFFNISPLEAEIMDPQQRLCLEECWKALEDAGYSFNEVSGKKIGVYFGVRSGDYLYKLMKNGVDPNASTLIGNDSAILSARISYFLNLKGPALSIDTACSSSLTAIHIACNSLYSGESEVALAGGVNITTTERSFITDSKAGMLSPEGKCKTFDNNADGFVPGEAVGVVVLKTLSKAKRDGDMIYGVIKGIGINQDGKTNGITAPSSDSQTDLICSILEGFNIDPRNISYVEAHGTGTKLGDPIEMEALSRAFSKWTMDKQYCAIGSVKTNVGHCIAAAGVVSLIKVLLSMKNNQLPASLNCLSENKYINFGDSPFYVNKKLEEWPANNDQARIAAISSFGFSGTNAHLIIQDYKYEDDSVINLFSSYLFCLSAKTEEVLLKKIKNFYNWLLLNADADLSIISYNLNIRDSDFSWRFAVISNSYNDLLDNLSKIIDGISLNYTMIKNDLAKLSPTSIFLQDSLDKLVNDIVLESNIGDFYDDNLTKLCSLYLQGYSVKWKNFYRFTKIRKISLPTYPFARERYWVPDQDLPGSDPVIIHGDRPSSVLHPLLHRNTSDFSEQRYSSLFSGEEFFLRDHQVNGRRILPGVASLEMAVCGLLNAYGRDLMNPLCRLSNVVWARPVVVDAALEIHLGLYPEDNGTVRYEIYGSGSDLEEAVVYSQGILEESPKKEIGFVNLSELQGACNIKVLKGNYCYDEFEKLGLSYGPSHQGIEQVFVGRNQALGLIRVSGDLLESFDQYVLHPGLLDSALQCSIGLIDELEGSSGSLPFALESLEVYERCSPSMWVHLRYSSGEPQSGKVQKLDIDLFDESGRVCVSLRGFSSRTGSKEVLSTKVQQLSDQNSLEGLVHLTPVWNVVNLEAGDRSPSLSERVVIIGADENQRDLLFAVYPNAFVLDLDQRDDLAGLSDKLVSLGDIDHLIWITPEESLSFFSSDSLIEDQNKGVLLLFGLIKALLGLGYGSRSLGWSVLTFSSQAVHYRADINPTHSSIHGLIGSMAKEYTNWNVRLVDLEDSASIAFEEIFHQPFNPQGDALLYREGQWYGQELFPLTYNGGDDSVPYKDGGVYVVIGGAGGIGSVWSESMIRDYGAHIIWIGRREQDASISEKIAELSKLGPAPYYISADATDYGSLRQAYMEIKQRHSDIHGVVHSALVLQDKSLLNMDEQMFRTSLSAKIDISVRIQQVFSEEPLDFIVFFSSLMSFAKAPGQSNYAAGCVFKDAFAHQLSRELPCLVKVMNWGYWGSVGVVSSDAYRDRMSQSGMDSIEPEEGIRAIQTLLGNSVNQMVLIKTNAFFQKQEISTTQQVLVYPQASASYIGRLAVSAQQELSHASSLRLSQSSAAKMDDPLLDLLWSQLCSMGLFDGPDFLISSIKSALDKRHWKWFDESVRVLSDKGYIRCDSGLCTVLSQAGASQQVWDSWEQCKSEWLEDQDKAAALVLVETTLKALPDILRGIIPATDVMFPNSSMHLVEGVYKHNQIADYFNETLADTVVDYLRARVSDDSSFQMRILEIGAGTGGTSAMLFSRLKPYQDHVSEYCYTDISKAFLLHAQREYGAENPYLSYKLLDVSQAVSGQGIDLGSYDIVLATNVLHATSNIRQALRNSKALLKSNGLLLLNEISGNILFTHLTFGLLDGWWLYEDVELRISGCPGLSPESWQNVLTVEGFTGVVFPAQGAHDLGRQVIVAESNGIIRQNMKIAVFEPQQNISPVFELKSEQPAILKSELVPSVFNDEHLRNDSVDYLKKIIGDTLRIPVGKIDSSEPLERYGIDSILVIQLTNALRLELEGVTSTLFFEYQTIDALVEYFMSTQKESLKKLLGQHPGDGSAAVDMVRENVSQAGPSIGADSLRRREYRQFLPQDKASSNIKENTDIKAKAQGTVKVQDVAIIGLSGRYAQSKNIAELWEHLKEGRSCITEIPEERWNWKKYYDQEKGKRGSIYSKWGGFIEDIDKFDPLFFQISPAEAEMMDPQERLFLETAYSSIEDAGYTSQTLSESRKVGIFVGVMNGNYASGASYWSVANRISYLLNFQGPSMAIDTACSSSLTAVHLALDSLYSGVSECAIAGGVNLIVDPVHYLKLSAMTMLTSDNQCKSFGENADGFVDGEGVGAIILKPLEKAIADGDHIYGVIKGSMINSVGKTNGYTVPSPNSQSKLVSDALERSGIHPRSISYIEAHGTGTSLGDPIEVAGLTKAFYGHTQEKQFCALGSVKSNIGHCESAAGIAGITKILLQLKHGQLVPSLHSKVLNPHINFNETPFTVQQELVPWNRPVIEIDGNTREYPRIAGISSFGAGGANAHVIIEEYVPQDIKPNLVNEGFPVIIVLSAKNKPQLNKQVAQLLDFIQGDEKSDTALVDIAYTLQVGREAMEERLGIIVDSFEELKQKLEAFIQEQDNISDLYRGQIKDNKENIAVFQSDDDLQQAIDVWIQKRKYKKLLELWVKGLKLDWHKLYPETKPGRISLPTYPFVRDRYWVTQQDIINANNSGGMQVVPSSVLHPLLHRNTSDFNEQRYSSLFSGEEFFLRDHQVNGRRILPGVASLEMAVCGLLNAYGRDLMNPLCRLSNVVWARPVVVDAALEIHLGLYSEDNGTVRYEIYGSGSDLEEAVVYSQGILEESPKKEIGFVNLSELQGACNIKVLKGNYCYDEFEKLGLSYGPSHQGIEQVYVGRNQALGLIRVSGDLLESFDQYVLHPGLLDSALQCSIGLIDELEGSSGSLPFALESLEVYERCSPSMWVHLRYSSGEPQSGKVQKLDIDLFDESGRVCVSLRGFSSRTGNKEVFSELDEIGVLELESYWREDSVVMDWQEPAYSKHIVLLCDQDDALLQGILSGLPGVECYHLKGGDQDSIDQRYENYSLDLLSRLQFLLQDKSTGRVLVQIVNSLALDQVFNSGLSGLLKTAHAENPKITGQFIASDSINELGLLISELKQCSICLGDSEIRYQAGKRFVRDWKEAEITPKGNYQWRNGGTYLITGGAGGLGLVFAREIVEHSQDIKLILTGRSVLDSAKEDQIKTLAINGAHVQYKQVDISIKRSVEDLFADIESEYGSLNGIIHSAGIIRDNYIIKKDKSEFRSVFAPKVSGLVNIDQASRDMELDFLVCFSSIAGSLGNAGQCDYSSANAFMDSYSEYRNVLVEKGERYGHTLSMNWPLWEEGGMKLDQGSAELLKENTGMTAMASSNGISALYRGLQHGAHQMMVMQGITHKLRQHIYKYSQANTNVNAIIEENKPDEYGERPLKTHSDLDLRNEDYDQIIEDILNGDMTMENFKKLF